MSEAVYLQAEQAIENGWLVESDYPRRSGNWYYRVVRIETGNIIVKAYDFAYAREEEWSPDDWRKFVAEDGTGLFAKTGLYSFAPADDPTISEKRAAHMNPDYYGWLAWHQEREIEQLKKRIQELEAGK